MGLDEAIAHDARYDRADEFLEVVHGHWDTWADDALIVDKTTGRFADPEKVRRIDHKGEHFRSRGPFTVPRSPQGHPVVIQAGQSGRGRRFASRWGELIFTSNPHLEPARKAYAELKADAAQHGRDPEQMKIATLCHPVVAPTKAEAEDKFALIETLPLEVDSLMLLSENTNFDFGSKPLDEPFTDAELARFTGTQSGRDRVLAALGDRKPTPRDFITITRRGQAAAALGRRSQGGRRHLRGVVHGARLRRLRSRRGLRARQLRGLRRARRPGVTAPRAVPEGIQGRDAEGEPRLAAARRRPSAVGQDRRSRSLEMQELATGYGLIEGPVWDPAKGLYFSDVLGGGVHLLDRAGKSLACRSEAARHRRHGVARRRRPRCRWARHRTCEPGRSQHEGAARSEDRRQCRRLQRSDNRRCGPHLRGLHRLCHLQGRGDETRQPLRHRPRWQGAPGSPTASC